MLRFGLTTAIVASIGAQPLVANPIHPFDAFHSICQNTDTSPGQIHDGLVEADWLPIAPADLPDEVLQAFFARSASSFAGSSDVKAFPTHWEKQ